MSLKLGIQHWAPEYYQVCSNDDPRLTFDLLCKGQLWFLMPLYRETLKWWITQKVYDVKLGIYSKLNDYMEIYMYQRSSLFFDLCPGSLRFH